MGLAEKTMPSTGQAPWRGAIGVFRASGARDRNNVEPGMDCHNRTNVWKCPWRWSPPPCLIARLGEVAIHSGSGLGFEAPVLKRDETADA
jgi:hypothetical protein